MIWLDDLPLLAFGFKVNKPGMTRHRGVLPVPHPSSIQYIQHRQLGIDIVTRSGNHEKPRLGEGPHLGPVDAYDFPEWKTADTPGAHSAHSAH
jgi:hypothetical protein